MTGWCCSPRIDTSVGYQPPNADPNDDGLDLLSMLRAEDVIDIPLVVENPATVQSDHIPRSGTKDVAAEELKKCRNQGDVQAQEHDSRVFHALRDCGHRFENSDWI